MTNDPNNTGEKTGRPTSLTPEVHDRIVKAIRNGCHYCVAATLGGITYTSFKRWMNRAEAGEEPFCTFAAAVKNAEAEAEEEALSVIRKAAKGWEETKTVTKTYPDGTQETTTTTMWRFDWTAAGWYLERKHPDRFSKTINNNSDDSGKRIKLPPLHDKELMQKQPDKPAEPTGD